MRISGTERILHCIVSNGGLLQKCDDCTSQEEHKAKQGPERHINCEQEGKPQLAYYASRALGYKILVN